MGQASDRDASNRLDRKFDHQKIKNAFTLASITANQVGTFMNDRAHKYSLAVETVKQELMKPIGERDDEKLKQARKVVRDNKKWEMGGNGRLLLTALSLAAGANVIGSTGQLIRATAVNTLQGLGAREVKLIADSLDSEVARAALHSVLAGAGAAAQGHRASGAALGACCSVVLNNLITTAYKRNCDLTLEQREACKNLVTNFIGGTTHALGGDAVLATVAAAIECENNAGVLVLPAMMTGVGTGFGTGLLLSVGLPLTGIALSVMSYFLYQDLVDFYGGYKTIEMIEQERGQAYVDYVLAAALAVKGIHVNYRDQRLFINGLPSEIWYGKQDSRRIAAPEQIGNPTPGFGCPEYEDKFRGAMPGSTLKPDTWPNHTGGNQLPDADDWRKRPGGFDSSLHVKPHHTGGSTAQPVTPLQVFNDSGDKRLPIPKPVTAKNGAKVESNPMHTPKTGKMKPNKGVEPKNSLEIFEKSKMTSDGTRWTRDANGDVHRFFRNSKRPPSADDLYHWTGNTGAARNPLKLNNATKVMLEKELGWKIK